MRPAHQTENIIATNKLIEIVLLMKKITGVVVSYIESITGDLPFVSLVFYKLLLPMYGLNILIHIVSRIAGLDREFVRWILLAELILSFTISYVIFGSYVILFIVIPIIISARTLNRVETHFTAFFSWVAFLTASLTKIHLNNVSDLFRNIHEQQGSMIWGYPESVIISNVIPTTFAFLMVMIVTDNIIINGKRSLAQVVDQSSKIAVLNSELDTASEIQRNALPPQNFTTPGGEISINAIEKPAREVGGDFYDYAMIDDTHLAFLVADVSDKGLSAAMFMMAAQRTLKIAIKETGDLRRAVYAANRIICQDNVNSMFLTAWIGIADLENHTLEYVNCGHLLPVISAPDKGVRFIENAPNLILGCFPEASYDVHRINYHSGDRIVIYTDGITDIRNGEDISFGEDGLVDTVKCGITSPEGIINECESFAGDVTQFDDMTVMEVSFS